MRDNDISLGRINCTCIDFVEICSIFIAKRLYISDKNERVSTFIPGKFSFI